MKDKWKRIRTRVIDWFKDVASLIKENKKIAIIVLAFILIVVIAIVLTSILGSKSKEVTTVLTTEEGTEAEDYAIPEDPLETDAYPEINDLMRKYYNAAASGDLLTINSIRTGLDDKEQIVIEKKAEYINSYPVITCYTKKGPVEDSYLVYAYYEVKLENFEEAVPGLNAWYVSKNEAGTYFINEDPQDEKIAEYCQIISVQDDVQDLSNTVNVKFNELMSNDEKLAAFMDEITVKMKVEVGEELAKASAETSEEATEASDNTAVANTNGEIKVKATTVVNVRTSDSEVADKVGKAQEGQEFTLLEEKVNGWSKIDFEGKEAYIKTEFLEKVGGSSESTDNNNDSSKNDEVTDEEAAAASPSSGTATVKETINVRKSASTTSDKLGVCYAGEKLEVVTKQGDGWTKVKYNGKTGFVKSEFLE